MRSIDKFLFISDLPTTFPRPTIIFGSMISICFFSRGMNLFISEFRGYLNPSILNLIRYVKQTFADREYPIAFKILSNNFPELPKIATFLFKITQLLFTTENTTLVNHQLQQSGSKSQKPPCHTYSSPTQNKVELQQNQARKDIEHAEIIEPPNF